MTEEVIEFVAEIIDTEALDALRRAEEEMADKAMGATAVVESPFDAAEKWSLLVSPSHAWLVSACLLEFSRCVGTW